MDYQLIVFQTFFSKLAQVPALESYLFIVGIEPANIDIKIPFRKSEEILIPYLTSTSSYYILVCRRINKLER